MKWHIGCSGFSYREWKDSFYPPRLPQREWFNYYSERFSTLELNVSFYRFPQVAMLQTWYKKSPVGFSFSVKAPRLITHFKQLIDCEKYLDDFYSVCRDGLKEKTGPLLFQFPPAFRYTTERLERIITQLKPGFMNVVEFRHTSWWDQKVYAALNNHGLIFCSMSYPNLPEDMIVTSATGYFRFHGIPRLYYSEYPSSYIENIADSILRQKQLENMYCYFNNTAGLGAINNAGWIEQYIL